MALPTSISVRLYTKSDSCLHNCALNATCESVCTELCIKLKISPAASYLFALRFCDTNNFLPGSKHIQLDQKYDFRLRFQVSSNSMRVSLYFLKLPFSFFVPKGRNGFIKEGGGDETLIRRGVGQRWFVID